MQASILRVEGKSNCTLRGRISEKVRLRALTRMHAHARVWAGANKRARVRARSLTFLEILPRHARIKSPRLEKFPRKLDMYCVRLCCPQPHHVSRRSSGVAWCGAGVGALCQAQRCHDPTGGTTQQCARRRWGEGPDICRWPPPCAPFITRQLQVTMAVATAVSRNHRRPTNVAIHQHSFTPGCLSCASNAAL